MTRRYELLQIDVFSATPLGGNPLAVFPEAEGLTDAEMQAIAREMNLSETTFVLPPERAQADYRVRIFTPQSELPFAGHPSVGTAYALVTTGRQCGKILHQETLAGLQEIRVAEAADGEDGPLVSVQLPAPRFEPAPPSERLAKALGIPLDAIAGEPLTVHVGVAWHIVPLRDLKTVRGLAPDMSALAQIEADTGVATTVFCEEAEDPECAVRVRSFAPGDGIPEDPVCGSGNGSVGAYRAHTGAITPPLAYRAEQGSEVDRPGRVQVQVAPGDPWDVRVGGPSVTVLEGWLSLPAL
jgi:PhzF family phenazine biosynthesis protein